MMDAKENFNFSGELIGRTKVNMERKATRQVGITNVQECRVDLRLTVT